jgi:molybdopterin converting factor small subunit
MSVTVKISSALRPFTNNKEALEVKGATVRDCLDDLGKQFPDIKKFLFDSRDDLMIFVLFKDEPINTKMLNTKVKDGDEIQIFMIMGGG